jgi:hypothetical protein
MLALAFPGLAGILWEAYHGLDTILLGGLCDDSLDFKR